MLTRDLLTLATMVSSLTVVIGASIDLDSGDYEVLADNEGKSDDNGKVTFSVHDFMGKSGYTVCAAARNGRVNGYTWVAPDTGTKSMRILELTFYCRASRILYERQLRRSGGCSVFFANVNCCASVCRFIVLRSKFIITRGLCTLHAFFNEKPSILELHRVNSSEGKLHIICDQFERFVSIHRT